MDEQRGGVLHTFSHMVVGVHLEQRGELLLVLDGAELGNVGHAVGRGLGAHSIEHAHLWHGLGGQLAREVPFLAISAASAHMACGTDPAQFVPREEARYVDRIVGDPVPDAAPVLSTV